MMNEEVSTAVHKNFDWIWPSITDAVSAEKASKQGLWACTWCAGATLLFVVLSVFGISLLGFDMWALLDAFLFIIIGWGIYKLNRFAAIAGLILYIVERAAMWTEHGPKNPVMAIIITLLFINSMRGIFAFHRYAKEQPLANSVKPVDADNRR
jgi:hypothetical protein